MNKKILIKMMSVLIIVFTLLGLGKSVLSKEVAYDLVCPKYFKYEVEYKPL